MSEWFKVQTWNVCVLSKVPRVRIPPSPFLKPPKIIFMDNLTKEHKLDSFKIDDFRAIFHENNLIEKLDENNSWSQICSAMDAIEVGKEIINKISFESEDRLAFELIELFTAGQMIRHGILRMNETLFEKEYELKEDASVFKYIKEVDHSSVSDDRVFIDYRAISFAHPVEVRSNNTFSNGDKCFYSWLIWDIGKKGDTAVTWRYPDNIQIKIKFDDVFQYVEKRYNYLDVIKQKIIQKYNIIIDEDWELFEEEQPNIKNLKKENLIANLDIDKI